MQLEKKARRNLAELTCAVVSAYCATRKMSPSELLGLIASVGAALRNAPAGQEQATAKPAPAAKQKRRASGPVAANDNVAGAARPGRPAANMVRPRVPLRLARPTDRPPPLQPRRSS